MGLFSKPKYVGYCFQVSSYHDALEFQDAVVRDANSDYNLDLLNPFRYQGDGYIQISYDCNSRKKPQVIVYVTDLTVLIAFEESLLSDEKVMAVADKVIEEFANNGIIVRFESSTKAIDDFKLFQYMKAVSGLY